jgi:excisionase family DNA binding protein
LNITTYIVEEQTPERRRIRGNWSISPLWESKILLGVLKQQGLVGKGLVEAFERWAPTLIGVSRGDISKAYAKQTARDLSDYILVQQADKAVRYGQLPPEAEGFRLVLGKSLGSHNTQTVLSALGARRVGPEPGGAIVPIRSGVLERIRAPLGVEASLAGARSSDALLSTNELAGLTGFAPKTIRRWASRRLLNFIRVGNQFRFRPAAVELFLAQREVRK